MFYGEHMHTLDAKGRLTMPAKYRTQLAEGVYVTKGEDRCLQVWSAREWEAKRIEVENRGVATRHDRRMMRGYFGGTQEGELDKQGRILLDAGWREYAGIERDCAVVGCGRFVEVWGAPLWEEERRLSEAAIADRDDAALPAVRPE
ncbi:MAG: division/cell wall cluster transcriptional repressor MraZ [Acidimicrobiia bacterium]|nr:division/cell wall cluster transcriptional repressor MraZ [Acidimicrobiia bacterium]